MDSIFVLFAVIAAVGILALCVRVVGLLLAKSEWGKRQERENRELLRARQDHWRDIDGEISRDERLHR